MKRRSFIVALFLLALPATLAGAQPPRTISLEEAYQLTLKQSEQLKLRLEDIRLADAQYHEALSAVFPKLTLNSSQRFRNDGSSSAFNNGIGFSQGGFSGGGTHNFSLGASLTQPIFHGFKDFMVFYAAKAEYRARNLNRDRFRETLYQNVAEAFYQVRLYQQDLEELQNTRRALEKRVAELNDFQKLGKSRPSEVDAVQVELAQARANESRSQGMLTASREALAFLVGLPAGEFSLTTDLPKQPLTSVDDYLTRVEQRLDLKAADNLVESSRYQLKAAERERWPGIDFEGNYYGVEDPNSGRDWDALIKLELPIFEGGRISSKIKQQHSLLHSARLQRDELRRIGERDVRTAFENVLASRNEADALAVSVQAAEANLKSQKHDYELGVVNNLDVLKAIQELSVTRRLLINARVNEQINRVRLEVAAGGIAK